MNRFSKLQLLILAVMVVVAAGGLVFFSSQDEEPANVPPAGPTISVHVLIRAGTDTLSSVPLLAGSPLTALTALEQTAVRANLPMGIRQYDFGKLVVSIGGYTAGLDGDWTYRVNDSLIPVAAEHCQLADGDRLEFMFGRSGERPGQPGDSVI